MHEHNAQPSHASLARNAFLAVELLLRSLKLRETALESRDKVQALFSTHELQLAQEHILLRRDAMTRELNRLTDVENFITLLSD